MNKKNITSFYNCATVPWYCSTILLFFLGYKTYARLDVGLFFALNCKFLNLYHLPWATADALILSLPYISSAKKNYHAAEIEDQSESSTLWWHHCFYLEPLNYMAYKASMPKKNPSFSNLLLYHNLQGKHAKNSQPTKSEGGFNL